MSWAANDLLMGSVYAMRVESEFVVVTEFEIWLSV
jgi:hypothetical protein